MIHALLLAAALLGTSQSPPRAIPRDTCEVQEQGLLLTIRLNDGWGRRLSIDVKERDEDALDPQEIVVMWACGEDPAKPRWRWLHAESFALPYEQWEAWQRLAELHEALEEPQNRRAVASFLDRLWPRRARR